MPTPASMTSAPGYTAPARDMGTRDGANSTGRSRMAQPANIGLAARPSHGCKPTQEHESARATRVLHPDLATGSRLAPATLATAQGRTQTAFEEPRLRCTRCQPAIYAILRFVF